ncbi:MAG: hypothetical protein OES27_08545 [Nitrosopumilus sp.]|nr:hypothetical protein [Nitrosopumilus sp.]
MKKIIIMFFILVIVSTNPAYGHKLISHDDTHRDFDSALQIPDHKISWAIYENLGINEAKFYSFDAKQGDSFYASIVIPKISGLEEYSPSFVLMDATVFENDSTSFENQLNTEKFLYEGNFPGNEFYEPFGQVTYWERQEVRTQIPSDGKYFIVVMDEKNQEGKYSLAIGTIEDFSGENIFTILPKAWLDTKLFVDDYFSIGILFFVLVVIPTISILIIIRKRKRLPLQNC